MKLEKQKVAIIGVGKTGRATARFLAGRGARIALTDEKPASAWGETLTELEGFAADLTVVPYGLDVLTGVDLIIPSPGVYPSNPILMEALRRKIPILSEMEMAWRFLKTPLAAVTGTNGKTTVTTLIGEMLRAAGIKVFVGGNIGTPLIEYVEGPQDADWIVAEVSSFQLQWVQEFHPQIALLLNVTGDHTDYHGSFDAYRRIKETIFARQTASDLAILNADEAATATLSGRLSARTELFSSSETVACGMFLEEGKMVRVSPSGGREEFPLGMIRIPGSHNVENVMASIIAARACGCPPSSIIEAVERFCGIAHRIEYAGEKDGVRFYDDSKGTNVGAVMRALESFTDPVILLLGGRDKEGDFAALAPLIRRGVRETVLFGEAREKINGLIGGLVRTTLAATMKEAVTTAYRHASRGDVVLLSPGCASFDEFANYKERGNVFQELVRRLER
jgi:UDP-N-acetylmuramoylalanine--D-glutamate ligase